MSAIIPTTAVATLNQLAQAHARLRLSPVVENIDAIVACWLMEESLVRFLLSDCLYAKSTDWVSMARLSYVPYSLTVMPSMHRLRQLDTVL